MKIEELLDKYFEGETSCEEERRLRRFFTEEEVPEELQMYRPLFAYLEQEATATQDTAVTQPQADTPRPRFRLHRAFYLMGSIAAGLLLLIGTAQLLFPLADAPENFVIIDGVRHTDENLAKAKAQEAMQIAGFTDEYLDGLLFGN